ncbi:hypothetical protein GCM10010272_61190 [Streptomyces lateritius]|nr:hypothetical protein GCM10010272_61190 [Streptomyces lateritius]
MRSAVEQDGVLAAGGLAFAAVDHHDGAYPPADRRLADGSELAAEGKTGATAPVQGYLLGELGEPLAAHRFQGPVHLQVHGEAEALDQVEALGELRQTDHADFRDVRERRVHGRSPAGVVQGSPAGGGLEYVGMVGEGVGQ